MFFLSKCKVISWSLLATVKQSIKRPLIITSLHKITLLWEMNNENVYSGRGFKKIPLMLLFSAV